MIVLFIGDIVGKPGRRALKALLPDLIAEYRPDLIIANVENLAGGKGVTQETLEEVRKYGVQVGTSGNHIFDKREALKFIDTYDWVLRPANYPPGAPGRGYQLFPLPGGQTAAVINLMGRLFMGGYYDCPFRTGKAIVENLEVPVKIVDFHAETTAEKQAFAHFMDGKVSAVIGTHTHVQTSDERILPGGTAYITDAGMTGGLHSVIGVKKDPVIRHFLTGLYERFEPATERLGLEGVVFEVDPRTGRAKWIKRVRQLVESAQKL